MTALAIIHKQEIIERLSSGEYLKVIAHDYLITPSAICNQLADDPDYQAAREASLEARMDDRESELEEATDMISVSRASKLLSHAAWRAERECPQRWGKDTRTPSDATNLNTISNLLLTQAVSLLPKPQVIDNTIDVVDVPITSVMSNK
jgi:hypothetical protein